MYDTSSLRLRVTEAMRQARAAAALFDYVLARCPRVDAWMRSPQQW